MFEYLMPNATACFYVEKNQSHNQNDLAKDLGFCADIQFDIKKSKSSHEIHALNLFGYVPVFSTFTGAYRCIMGLAYLIKSLVCVIFDWSRTAEHVEGIKIGLVNVIRGLIEIVPVVGNLVTLNIDLTRIFYAYTAKGNDKYADGEVFKIFSKIDMIGAMPVIGTIVNAAKAIFFAIHVAINIPVVFVKDCRGFTKGISQVVLSLIEMVPFVGLASYALRRKVSGKPFNAFA